MLPYHLAFRVSFVVLAMATALPAWAQAPEVDRSEVEAKKKAQEEKEKAKAAKLAAKTAKREQVSRSNRKQGVADQSQVLARRREFERGKEAAVEAAASSQVLSAVPQARGAANENQLTGRSRSVLTLKRA